MHQTKNDIYIQSPDFYMVHRAGFELVKFLVAANLLNCSLHSLYSTWLPKLVNLSEAELFVEM